MKRFRKLFYRLLSPSLYTMCRYQKTRFRCLVLWLSIIDFTSCCSTVPMEAVSTWLWFSAPSRILCKAKNFCVQFTRQSAIYMLFVTAVYKYRQICHPFKNKQCSVWLLFRVPEGLSCHLLIWLKFEPIRDIIVVLLTCKNEEDPMKNKGARVPTTFFPL